jgi:hypothetical protein
MWYSGLGIQIGKLGRICLHIGHFQLESESDGTPSFGILIPKYSYLLSYNFLPLDKFDEKFPSVSGYKGSSTGALGETLAST